MKERLHRWDRPWDLAAVGRCKFIRNRFRWFPVRAHLDGRRVLGEEHPARAARFVWFGGRK